MPFDPEKVWQQSDLDLSTTAGFLHENCLHFLEDSAIIDAALESEFFSDAGTVLPQAQEFVAESILHCQHLSSATCYKCMQLLHIALAKKQPLKGASIAGRAMQRVLG